MLAACCALLALLTPAPPAQSTNVRSSTRRALLLASPASAAALLLGSLPAVADVDDAVAPIAAPAAAPPPAPPPAPPTGPIAYSDVLDLLKACRDGDECQVAKIVFTVSNGESAEALFVSGVSRPIVGIPPDNPNTDSSPYKLVAKARDAKVPYSFPFDLSKYKKN